MRVPDGSLGVVGDGQKVADEAWAWRDEVQESPARVRLSRESV